MKIWEILDCMHTWFNAGCKKKENIKKPPTHPTNQQQLKKTKKEHKTTWLSILNYIEKNANLLGNMFSLDVEQLSYAPKSFYANWIGIS